MRVLRLCSVFEVPPAVLEGAVRFDPVGGMQNHTAELTRRLDLRGVAQTVVTTRPPGAPARDTLGRQATILRVGLPIPTARQLWSLPAARLVPRLARGADLIHVHLGEDLAAVPLARLAAGSQRPMVLTLHTSLRHTLRVSDPRSALMRTLGGLLQRWGERTADAVIALTPRVAGLLRADGIDADRVHVIPSGVDLSLFDGPHQDPFPGIPRPRVVYVGRLAAQKGVVHLVRAAACLRSTEAHVVLVGDGPARSLVEQDTRALGLAGRVHVTGFLPHDQVPAALAHADVFVMPSVYEELGSAVLEALFAGLPIVATDVGGLPDVIADGEDGVLVPPADPRALAAAIDGLLADPVRARRLAARARSAGVRYDWSRLAGEVHDVYRTVLGVAVPAEASDAA